jgi:hypothetical protein
MNNRYKKIRSTESQYLSNDLQYTSAGEPHYNTAFRGEIWVQDYKGIMMLEYFT